MERSGQSPTPFPTQLPWSQSIRNIQMITGESISLFNRLVIGAICVYRLTKYKRAGVFNLTELKTLFHFLMLLSVPFCVPYFTFCLSRYENWQCYANKNEVSENVYRATWTVYSLYRIGLSFQLGCLSVMVLCWSRFLSYSERIGRMAQVTSERHVRLANILLKVNFLGIAGSVIANIMIMSEPTRAENDSGQESVFLYLDWYYLDFVQLALAVFLLRMGDRMLKRLKDSVVLNGKQKRHVLRKLNAVLYLIIFCILLEVASRIILSMPGFVGETKWEDKPQPWYDMRHFLENQSLVWQFVGYILPYDVVSFCLLYLMRAPMKQEAVFSANVDESEDEESFSRHPNESREFSRSSSERTSSNNLPPGTGSGSGGTSSVVFGDKTALLPFVLEDDTSSSNSLINPLAGESGSDSLYQVSKSLINPLLSSESGSNNNFVDDADSSSILSPERRTSSTSKSSIKNGSSYSAVQPTEASLESSNYCADREHSATGEVVLNDD